MGTALTPTEAGRLARLVRRVVKPMRGATLGDWLAALFLGAVAMICADSNGADLHAAIVAGIFSALGSLARLRLYRGRRENRKAEEHKTGRRKDEHGTPD